MGPIILREKKMGYFHTKNTCQVGLKDLEGHCDEKKKKNKKDTEIKKITSKHQNDTILHKYMRIEKSSSWYP